MLNGGSRATTAFLLVKESKTGLERRLVYEKFPGHRKPGVLFVPGYLGDKDMEKPTRIKDYCVQNGIPFTRYDPTGMGESTMDISRKEAKFSHWLEDARRMLLDVCSSPQIVIGSSMGGWICMCLTKQMPEKFSSLLLLAPAYNFGQRLLTVMKGAPKEALDILESGEVWEVTDPNYPAYGPMPLSYAFCNDLIEHDLSLETGSITVECPTRILHGLKDKVMHHTQSEALIQAITGEKVSLTLLKMAEHELTEEESMKHIFEALEGFLEEERKKNACL